MVITATCLYNCRASTTQNAKESIIGEWRSNVIPNQGNIIFNKDSAYYPYYNRSFAYKITDDSLIIEFNDKTSRSKYRMLSDTIIFYSDDGTDTIFRK